MIRFDFPQRSDEWKAARLGLATASCFGDILATIKSGEAADRRNYRARLVVERLTGQPTETFENQAMRDGTEREPLARAAYETRTGEFVEEVGLIRHDSLEVACSPDGFLPDGGCLEIKSPSLATHLEYLKLPANSCPSRYLPQIMGQMWLAEREWCDFVSFHPHFPENLRVVVRRVQRDDDYIGMLQDRVAEFMDEVRKEEATIRAIGLLS